VQVQFDISVQVQFDKWFKKPKYVDDIKQLLYSLGFEFMKGSL